MADDREGRAALWFVGTAAAAAVAGALWLMRQTLSGRSLRNAAHTSAGAARSRIRKAAELKDCAIHVVGLAPGIVELRGFVLREDQAHRAVELAQQPDEVHTVLNRLGVAEEESQLAATRRRFAAGAADLHETHWYGMGAGMGRRPRHRRHNGRDGADDGEQG